MNVRVRGLLHVMIKSTQYQAYFLDKHGYVFKGLLLRKEASSYKPIFLRRSISMPFCSHSAGRMESVYFFKRKRKSTLANIEIILVASIKIHTSA